MTVDDRGQGGPAVMEVHSAWAGTTGAEPVREPARAASLGEVIRTRRLELGLKQEELAARVSRLGSETRQSDISRLERGRVTLPRYDRLRAFAVALDLPIGELLARAGWAGAHVAFERAPDPVRADPQPVLDPSEALPEDPDWRVESQRLRAALDRARRTRARTAELLRRSRHGRATGKWYGSFGD